MIRIDQIWLAVDPIDMRCGPDAALVKVMQVSGTAHRMFHFRLHMTKK